MVPMGALAIRTKYSVRFDGTVKALNGEDMKPGFISFFTTAEFAGDANADHYCHPHCHADRNLDCLTAPAHRHS